MFTFWFIHKCSFPTSVHMRISSIMRQWPNCIAKSTNVKCEWFETSKRFTRNRFLFEIDGFSGVFDVCRVNEAVSTQFTTHILNSKLVFGYANMNVVVPIFYVGTPGLVLYCIGGNPGCATPVQYTFFQNSCDTLSLFHWWHTMPFPWLIIRLPMIAD